MAMHAIALVVFSVQVEAGGNTLRARLRRSAQPVQPADSPELLAEAAFSQVDFSATPRPLTGNAPEAVDSLGGYEIAQPTPRPVPFDGQYCRGHACGYRITTPMPVLLPTTPFPNTVLGLNDREFCRGLSCIPFMGYPRNLEMDGWNLLCDRLFNYLGGGLKGDPAKRTLSDIRDSWVAVCSTRVGLLEIPACNSYAEIIVAAMAPVAENVPAGDVPGVCSNMFLFMNGIRGSMIDLRFTKETLPKKHGASLLSVNLNRLGSGGVGPDTPRGRKWREFAWTHFGPGAGQAQAPLTTDEEMPSGVALLSQASAQWGSDAWAGAAHDKVALLSRGREADGSGCLTAASSGAASDKPPAGTYPATSLYRPNPPCKHGANRVPQSQTMYAIAGPLVEAPGDLMSQCQSQMAEIMLGLPQTPDMTVQMTKDWCGWQSSITSWIGQKQEFGHPDWNLRSCTGMASLLVFSLHDQMGTGVKLVPKNICSKIYMKSGWINRIQSIVDDVWSMQTVRGAPELKMTTGGGDDTAMKKLLKQAESFANAVYGKLRGQKAGYDAANSAKMDTAAWDPANVQANIVASDAPSLPDADDFA